MTLASGEPSGVAARIGTVRGRRDGPAVVYRCRSAELCSYDVVIVTDYDMSDTQFGWAKAKPPKKLMQMTYSAPEPMV